MANVRPRFAALLVAVTTVVAVSSVARAAPARWLEAGTLLPSAPDAEAQFSWSLGMDGDTAIVGAFLEDTEAGQASGAAYIYERKGLSWTQTARLTPRDARACAEFGYAVALSGATAAVSTLGRCEGDNSSTNAVYVFERLAGTWTQTAKLTSPTGPNWDWFGHSVSVSRDTVLVGAPQRFESGAADVFVRSSDGWTHQAVLRPADSARGDTFGSRVVVENEMAFVTSRFDDTAGGENAGSATIFTRDGDVWTERAQLVAPAERHSRYFGLGIAVSGDTAAIGAPGQSSNTGAVYIFRGAGSSWTLESELGPSNNAPSDFFGFSIALDGDSLVVGAVDAETSAGQDAGFLDVFARHDGVWDLTSTLFAADAAAGDELGESVGISGQTILAGVRMDDTAAGPNAGSVRVFEVDTDSDGIRDEAEATYGTAPSNPDTDGDGALDGLEVRRGLNPLDPDSDHDGLLDGDELKRGTDPLDPDTDSDTLTDGDEVMRGIDPLDPDTDGDLFADNTEVSSGSDPDNPCSIPGGPVGASGCPSSLPVTDDLPPIAWGQAPSATVITAGQQPQPGVRSPPGTGQEGSSRHRSAPDADEPAAHWALSSNSGP